MNSYIDYHHKRGNDIYRMNNYIPNYIMQVLPESKRARILDIGCGNGSFLYSLRINGYTNLCGIDMDPETVQWVKRNNIPCECMNIMDFYPTEKFEFVTMNHVLEHFSKEDIIPALSHIMKDLLVDGGEFLIRVPNAQSNTGCYWAYEDFTHSTLFTAGSLGFVLRTAGFSRVDFLDEDGLHDVTGMEKIQRELFLKLYRKKNEFWNKVTGGAYHGSSRQIYTWELKALARKG